MRTTDLVKFSRKKAEILDAAARCFARDGFHAASIASICAEAEISPGHLYHYFENKEAIVGAIIESYLEVATSRFRRVMSSDDIVGALVAEVEAVSARKEDLPKRRLKLEMMAEAGRNQAIAELVAEHTRSFRAMLVDLLRDAQARGQVDPGLEVETAAAMLLSVIDGVQSWPVRDPHFAPTNKPEMLARLFTRFLQP